MVQKAITLPLGGVDRTLLFGVSGFLQYVRDQIKSDPFEFMDKNILNKEEEENTGQNVLVLFDDLPVIVYAGLNCYLDSRNEKNESFTDVSKWCRALGEEIVIEIYKESYTALLTTVKKEALPEVANGQEKVSA
jgi:hypothetical protein